LDLKSQKLVELRVPRHSENRFCELKLPDKIMTNDIIEQQAERFHLPSLCMIGVSQNKNIGRLYVLILLLKIKRVNLISDVDY
jgi:hypothetical protein